MQHFSSGIWLRWRLLIATLLTLTLSASLLIQTTEVAEAHHQITVPQDFTATRVASSLSGATAMAQAPDGRFFISQQNGTIRIVENDTLVAAPWGTVPVQVGATQGLFGLTFDPDFETNGYLYVFHTRLVGANLRARVSRYTSNGNSAASGPTKIWESPNLRLNTAVSHYGGDLLIGPDEKLYISFGDDLFPARSQQMNSVFGKILRLNLDGTIPTDNPFYTTTSGANRAIYALGVRNPFKMALDPVSGRIFEGDVGNAAIEEINDIVAGGNYGWPTYEGSSGGAPGFVDPVAEYLHINPGGVQGCATSAGAFYNPETSQFPAIYGGQFFASDFCEGWIKVVDPATGAISDFAIMESPLDLVVSPQGDLYALSRQPNVDGETSGGSLWKFEFSAPGSPVITDQPDSQTATAGAPVSFSVTATGDAPLTYQWQRNGVDIPGATAASYTFTPTLADDEANFRVLVTNPVTQVLSNTAELQVNEGGGVPVITFTEPLADTTWGGGDVINFGATVTDPEDGIVPASAYTWTINLHHDDHFHPVAGPDTGSSTGSFTVPVAGETSPNVFFRIILDVEDSSGNEVRAFTDIQPRTATLDLETVPPGLTVTVDGQTFVTPASILGVEGIEREISAFTPQTLGGDNYQWQSWSNAQSRDHVLSFPASNTTLTATFTQGGAGGVAPTITDEPADATVLDAETASFSVTAAGDEPLSYQWQREGIDIVGATDPSYTTPNLTLTDDFAGYRVLVTNDVGTVASRTAIVRVLDGSPRVTDGLTGLWDFSEGSGATVADTSGFESPLDLTIADPANVTWIPGGGLTIDDTTNISSGVAATKLIDASTAAAEITLEAWVTPKSANPSKAGRIAALSNGSQRNAAISQGWWNNVPTNDTFAARARTTSNYNNAIATQSGSVSTALTHVVFVRAAAGNTAIYVDGLLASSGISSGTFVWHNDVPFVIGNALNGNYPFLGDIHLVATYDRALSPTDIQANFEAGVAVAPDIDPPAITTPPADQTVIEGTSASFAVAATGDAPRSYQWKRNGADIPGATSITYVTPLTTLADSGDTFSVVVSNPAGSVESSTAALTVQPFGTPQVRVTSDLTGLWNFLEGSGSEVSDSSGIGVPLNLTIADPSNVVWLPDGGLDVVTATTISTAGPASKVIDPTTVTGEMTFEAWVVPDDLTQNGPARIATISASTTEQNALLGQGVTGLTGDRIEARFRTTSTNLQGQPASQSPPASLTGELDHIVFTHNADDISQIWINGLLRTQDVVTGSTATWDPSYPLVFANEASQDRPWLGELHLVATYSRALTPSEITQNFAAGTLPLEAPEITLAPADLLVTEGDSAEFNVEATGTSPLEYQWLLNGSPIPGATSTTYSIAETTLADDQALLSVTVTNVVGSVESAAATLTVEGLPVPPTITTDPSSLTVTAGDDALFVVEASGDDPLAYDWRRNGASLGAPSLPQLTISASLGDDGASFDVVVTNGAGSATSAPAILTVVDGTARVTDGLTGLWEFGEGAGALVADSSNSGAPMDLTIANPANVSWLPTGGVVITAPTHIASDGPATKLIDASVASGEVTIEAWVTPAEVNPAGSGRIAGLIDGLTGGTKRNASISQGWYNNAPATSFNTRMRTSSSYNNPLSSGLGSVTEELTHVVVTGTAGGSERLYINGALAAQRSLAGTFVWHNDIPFVIGNELDDAFPFLGSIHLVAYYDSALSAAEVTQNFDAGVDTGPTNQAPTVDAGPDQTITLGESATLNGTSTDDGLPVPPSATSATWSAVGPGVVTFGASSEVTTAQFDAAGLYTLTLTIDDGARTAEDSLVVDVQGPPAPPEIVTSPQSQSLIVGETAQFSVTASGDDPLSYQWQRDGSNLEGETAETLTVPAVTLDDNGAEFNVVVTNAVGSVTSAVATLTVTEMPDGVTVAGDPTVTVVPSVGQLDVTWEPVPGAALYQLRYRPLGAPRSWDSPTTDLARVITGLANELDHTVEVRALIGSTWGPFTTVVVATG